MISIREELAWAAGLFEGEGCITQTRRSTGYAAPRLQMSMADIDVVRRFALTVGVGSLHWITPRRLHHSEQLLWSVTRFEHVQAVLAMFWPWLGDRRRARARQVLLEHREHLALAPIPRRLRTHCPNGHAYDGPNTYLSKRGSRVCRTCCNASHRRWYEDRKVGVGRGG